MKVYVVYISNWNDPNTPIVAVWEKKEDAKSYCDRQNKNVYAHKHSTYYEWIECEVL